MEREIDLTPRHLVDWLKADLASGSAQVEVRATREYLAETGPASAGDLDSEDEMTVMLTVGLLEVTPARGPRWTLRVRVEDPVGAHLPEDGSVQDEPEEIALDEFESCFLADDDRPAAVTVETDGAAHGGRGFERVLARILADRHGRKRRERATQPRG